MCSKALCLLLLRCDLLEQNFLRISAGTLDGTGLEGIRQVRITQRFQIAAAAAGFAEIEIISND